MSTRAAITRPHHDGFIGRYHHFDGYPQGLGHQLWQLYHGHFAGDLPGMLTALIDAHPAGWSSIDGDWSKTPGFDRHRAPACYCHGERSEGEQTITEANAAACGCEYAYVLARTPGGVDQMTVLSSYHPNGAKMVGAFGRGDPASSWRILAVVEFGGAEPDWDAVENSDGEEWEE